MADRTDPPMPRAWDDLDPPTRLGALRRGVAAGLRRVNRLVDPTAAEALDRLAHVLAVGDLTTMAAELGIVGRGGVSRDAARALEYRDFLIRALARAMGVDGHGLASAALVVARFRRYEATAWSRDRNRPAPPADPASAYCWHLLKLDLPETRKMPSPKTVAEILRARPVETRV